MDKQIKELSTAKMKSVRQMVARQKEKLKELTNEGYTVKFVGLQLHFLITDKNGNNALSSLGGYSEGFHMEDYEQ